MIFLSGVALAGMSFFSVFSAQAMLDAVSLSAVATSGSTAPIVPDFSVLVNGGADNGRDAASGSVGKLSYDDITIKTGM
ncbi:hypothetical protein OG462_43085 [Streptomyces sp. NBC_01077]|uniref:hypothetical protein n=1 Tax=Streptomyces sp. NBC_01077 TaxID=2903746 RepID=UPI00386358AB|nr:hypothetical protein OG462_01920 [Streptomyces sp. NBC_01077]WSV43586.1 hypothetical protein OG462_43085 [Streptomyces sp. NBC_01077]